MVYRELAITMTAFPFSKFISSHFKGFLQNSFCKYVEISKNNNVKDEDIAYVIGNSAADLDSIASSLAYAYYLNHVHKRNVFPLHRIKSSEWKLRKEIDFLQEALEIDMSSLIWSDVHQNRFEKETNWILVDHHELGGLKGTIVEVIDHHVLSNQAKEMMNANWIIELVGSCATLIAEKLIDEMDDKTVLLLLLTTILIDTVNLDAKYKKVTNKDIIMANKLSKKLGLSSSDLESLFLQVQAAKFDVSSLSLEEQLQSDYKEFIIDSMKIGIASIRQPWKNCLQKEKNYERILSNFIINNNISLLLIMTAFEAEGIFQRELIFFYDTNLKTCSHIENYLKNSNIELTLIISEKLDSNTMSHYSQGDITKSRKSIVPLLFQMFGK